MLRTLGPEHLAQEKVSFQDSRLEEVFFRYRARNFPASLDASDLARWEAHRTACLHQGAGSSRSLAAFFEQIDALSEQADERGEAILGALYDYAESIAPPAN